MVVDRAYDEWIKQGRPGNFESWVKQARTGTPSTYPYIEPYSTAIGRTEEFFPGYKGSLASLVIKTQDAAKRYSTATGSLQKALEKSTEAQPLYITLGGDVTTIPATMSEEEANRIVQESAAEVTASEIESHRSDWRFNTLFMLPAVMADTVEPVETAEQAMSKFPSNYISEEDRAWFTENFDRMKGLLPSERNLPITPAEIRKALTVPEPHPVLLSQLTTQELVTAMTTTPKPNLARGLTDKDLINILGKMQPTEEEKAAFEDTHKISLEYQKIWKERAQYTELVKAGLTNPELDKLSRQQLVKLISTQPMLATMEMMESYFKALPRPAAAWVMANIKGPLGETKFAQDIRAIAAEYRREGDNSWQAYSKSFDVADGNIFGKIVLETIFDPTTYIGMGIATKIAKASKLPRLGKFVGAVETGWNEFWDVPFYGIRAGIHRIPKTPLQAATVLARQALTDTRSLLIRTFGAIDGVTAEQLQALSTHILKVGRVDPTATADDLVKVFHYITEHDFVDDILVSRWLRKVKSDMSVTPRLLENIESLWHDYWMRAGDSTIDKAADDLLSLLGGGLTDENRTIARDLLKARETEIETTAKRLFELDNPEKIIDNITFRYRDLMQKKLESPMWKFANQQGMVTAWSRKVDRILRWSWINKIDTTLTKPMANQYLLFANYGPFNAAETVLRNVLGGGDVWYPRNADTISEYAMMAEGLSTAEYSMILAARDSAAVRGEMAIIREPGHTLLDRIPGITKDLKHGVTLTLGGRKYSGRSMESVNLMWSDIQTRLRAYAYTREYIKVLSTDFPDEFKILESIVRGESTILDGVKAFPVGHNRNDFLRIILQASTNSPEAVGRLAVPKTQLERQRILSEASKELDKSPDIPSPIRKAIETDILSGKFFKDIPAYALAAKQMLSDFNLGGLLVHIGSLKRFTADFVGNPPRTAEELFQHLGHIRSTLDAVEKRVEEARRIVQHRTPGLKTPAGKEAYTNTTNQMIEALLSEYNTSVDYMHRLVANIIGGEDYAMQWDKVAFENMSEEQIRLVQSFVDELPLEMKANISKIGIDKSLTGRTDGWYSAGKKAIGIKPSVLKNKDTFMHEMSHGLLADKIDSSDYQFVFDYLKAIGKEGSEQWNFTVQARSLGWDYKRYNIEAQAQWSGSYERYRQQPMELFAFDFGAYVTGKATNPGFNEFAVSHMPTRLFKFALSDEEKLASLELNDILLKRAQLLERTRQEEFDITKRLLRDKPKNAGEEFWGEGGTFYLARDVPWTERRALDMTYMGQQDELVRRLSKQVAPEVSVPPDTSKGLAPQHIAYIFGVTNDDVTRSLLRAEMDTIMPKDYYIDRVRLQAERVASKVKVGKTADDIGFTIQAIGDTYDQILRTSGFEPTWLKDNPLVKGSMQLDAVFDQIERTSKTSKISQADYDKITAYIHSVEDKLRKSPLYEPAKVSQAIPVEPEQLRQFDPLPGDSADLVQKKLENYVDYVDSHPAVQEELKNFLLAKENIPDISPVLFYSYGGKTRMASQIISEIGDVSGDIIEPFFGTGAVSIGLKRSGGLSGKIVAYEANPRILGIYKAAKEQPQEFLAAVKAQYPDGYSITEEKLVQILSDLNNNIGTEVEQAAKYVVITRHAARNDVGIKNGKLRAWFGRMAIDQKYTQNYASRLEQAVKAVSDVDVQKATKTSYKEAMRSAKAGDVIYLDPPYTGVVIQYPGTTELGGWTSKDTDELFKEAQDASKKGVRVVISEGVEAREKLLAVGASIKTIHHPWKPKTKGELLATLDLAPHLRPQDVVNASIAEPILAQEAKDVAEKIVAGKVLSPAEEQVRQNYKDIIEQYLKWKASASATKPAVTSTMGIPGAVPPTAESQRLASAGLPTWRDKKEASMLKARQQVGLNFTDYGNDNVVDAFMKHIFPFWTYESQRFFWLPRTFLRTPGVLTGLGRYMNYSDTGYVPIPGTDLQVNPFRGSVFMGGFRRMFQKDYPEYYDAWPGMKVLDYMGRLGFYPGIPFTMPIAMFGAKANRRPELGELLPSWTRTGLDIVVSANPDNKFLTAMTQQVFPDRFRNYQATMSLASEGIDGLSIWDKLEKGEKLLPEEEASWNKAIRRVSGMGVLMEQVAIFRFRPREYTEYLSNSRKAIEQLTGISVEQQERISYMYPTTGKKLTDYVHLDIGMQKFLREMEGVERWQGITSSLVPSAWQEEDRLVRRYYDDVEALYNKARVAGIYDDKGKQTAKSISQLTQDWIEGRINARQWTSQRGELASKLAFAVEALSNSTEYEGVPKTLEQRTARYLERGMPALTQSPDEELMRTYFEIKPELVLDEESGVKEQDFDTYYARIDALLSALEEPYRQIFIDRIQSSWLPIERLYWQISREYIRPYKKLRSVYLNKYTPEEQAIINKVSRSEGAEREELMNIIDPRTGNKLYNQFQSELSAGKTNLRRVSPDLDAWLLFWGRVTKAESEEAGRKYEELRKQYLVPSMDTKGSVG